MDYLNALLVGDSAHTLAQLPDSSIDLVVTSPPYWTAVEYDQTTIESAGSYDDYINALLAVWQQCLRVLRPNGKLAINTPLLPVPKKIIGQQHTRHIKNINNDIEASILNATAFLRYGLFVWQKQTSKMMFGSYPFPGNIIENNTIEFINVLVKPGKPPKYAQSVKNANRLSQAEWIDLAQQVWFMYPEDIKRDNDHPAPFPEKLPGRLIRMYTFGATGDFPGDVVLDPFCGTGTACAVAKKMGRRFVGIDISAKYIAAAKDRVALAREHDPPLLLVGRGKYPGKDDLRALQTQMALGNHGAKTLTKHKRQTYGRASPATAGRQLDMDFLEVSAQGKGHDN
jgi:DNA modification methylase